MSFVPNCINQVSDMRMHQKNGHSIVRGRSVRRIMRGMPDFLPFFDIAKWSMGSACVAAMCCLIAVVAIFEPCPWWLWMGAIVVPFMAVLMAIQQWCVWVGMTARERRYHVMVAELADDMDNYNLRLQALTDCHFANPKGLNEGIVPQYCDELENLQKRDRSLRHEEGVITLLRGLRDKKTPGFRKTYDVADLVYANAHLSLYEQEQEALHEEVAAMTENPAWKELK